jgi:hypothetical protein
MGMPFGFPAAVNPLLNFSLTDEKLMHLAFTRTLKVHKIENFFDSDFGSCVISLLVISKH